MLVTQFPTIDRLRSYVQYYQAPITGWPQLVLFLAGLYNISFGFWAIFFPEQYFKLNNQAPTAPELWQCIGMIVGLYGLGYLIACTDIRRYWPIVLIGLLGKILGPLGFLAYLVAGKVSLQGALVIFFNDLIWIIPFAIILAKAIHVEWRERQGIATALPREFLEGFEHISKIAGEGRFLLIFVRHLGCIFCQEALLRLAAEFPELKRQGVKVAVVHMGSTEKFAEYLAQIGLQEVVPVADTQQVLYDYFRLRRASLLDAFSPTLVAKAIRAMRRYRIGVGKLQGDGFQLAGCFLLDSGEVIKEYRNLSVNHEIEYLDFACGAESCAETPLKLFYDGQCPLCSREIEFLISLISPRKVEFIDISSPSFSTDGLGKTQAELMAEIHALEASGKWLKGMEAFRAVYAASPYGILGKLSALPGIRQVFDFIYAIFARNRLRLTGR